MNGLEAIELMNRGKMVIRISTQILYRLQDGVLEGCDHAGTWKSNWLFDFNAEYEEYIEPKKLKGWELANENCIYYFINDKNVSKYYAEIWSVDNNRYDNANYFSTKEKAEEINFKQTLFRKLQRFSDENGGNEIDWNDENQLKYCIVYDSKKKRVVTKIAAGKQFGQVYFQSFTAAQEAFGLFKDDLIKYFTM